MKKYVLPLLTAALTASFAFAAEDKPKVIENEEQVLDAVTERLNEARSRVSELSQNNATVLKYFDTFADLLSRAYHKEKSMTAAEIQEVCEGLEFAAEKHRLQTRKNAEKTPYISHPIGVANHLMNIGEVRDSALIIAALLHDTLEDTQTTLSEIEDTFGQAVAGYVDEVSDNKSLAKEARKRLQVITAPHKSKGAAQIKLADKLYNLNDLLSNPPADWTEARIDRYYEWAQSVVDRLPKANDHLFEAVDNLINAYWEKQESPKTR